MLLRLKIRNEDGEDVGYVINPFRVIYMMPKSVKNIEAGTVLLLSNNDEYFSPLSIDVAQARWDEALERAYTVIIANVIAEELANEEEE